MPWKSTLMGQPLKLKSDFRWFTAFLKHRVCFFFKMLIPSQSVGNCLSRWWPCWDFQPLGVTLQTPLQPQERFYVGFFGANNVNLVKVESSNIFWNSMLFPCFSMIFFHDSPPEIATRLTSATDCAACCLLPMPGGLPGLASDCIKWEDSTKITIHLAKFNLMMQIIVHQWHHLTSLSCSNEIHARFYSSF